MTTVVLVGFGLVLLCMGVWGRRNAERLAVVPGMPDDLVDGRTRVMRRGATACAVLGVVFTALGVASPLL